MLRSFAIVFSPVKVELDCRVCTCEAPFANIIEFRIGEWYLDGVAIVCGSKGIIHFHVIIGESELIQSFVLSCACYIDWRLLLSCFTDSFPAFRV